MQNISEPDRFADCSPQLVLQALLASNLTSFTEFAFGVVRPDVPFKPNWHFEAVTHTLSEVASGEVRRLIITLPPRNLKSLCASVALPAWFLGRNPHQDDLAGYLQEQGGFEVLNLPAIAQRNETYFLGDGRTYDRQKGELLHPEHEPAHVLAELKREMGPIAFSAQYQQSPIPPGGAIIKRKWLAPYDNVDRQSDDRIIMSWDIALSEAETGDYSACVVLLRRKEVFYILEVVRGRFPFDTLKRKVMEVKRRYDSPTLLIEDSPISRGLIQSLKEQSINVTVYKPDTDKRARVIAQTDLFAGGSIRLPRRAAWLEDFTAELLAFPGRAMTIRSMPSPRASHGVAS